MQKISRQNFERFVAKYRAEVIKVYGNKYLFNTKYESMYFDHSMSQAFIDIWCWGDCVIHVEWWDGQHRHRKDGSAAESWTFRDNGIITLNKVSSNYSYRGEVFFSLAEIAFGKSYIILNEEPFNELCNRYKILFSDRVLDIVAAKENLTDLITEIDLNV